MKKKKNYKCSAAKLKASKKYYDKNKTKEDFIKKRDLNNLLARVKKGGNK